MQNNTFFGHSKPNNIIVLEKIDSTNDYLKELLSNFKPLDNYTAIMAKEQYQGKGQRGNKWLAKPNENMTSSFLIYPNNLDISKGFLLTIISSLAVYDVIQQITNQNVYIKWPNDIMVNNKKIAGILIENKIKASKIYASIVGIGVNINQKKFPDEIEKHTISIKLVNNDIDISPLEMTKKIQEKLKFYTEMIEEFEEELLLKYNKLLFQKNELKTYKSGDKSIKGTIKEVTKEGVLIVEYGNKLNFHDLKSIKYLL